MDRSAVAMWFCKPDGLRIKCLMQYLHTSFEVKMTGNNILYSRAVLVFDSKFDSDPKFKLMKEVLTQVFTVTRVDKQYKPFIDHAFSFSIVGEEIHFRHYELIPSDKSNVQHAHLESMVEIGPRWSVKIERIFGNEKKMI